jgi:hypothetical protein
LDYAGYQKNQLTITVRHLEIARYGVIIFKMYC